MVQQKDRCIIRKLLARKLGRNQRRRIVEFVLKSTRIACSESSRKRAGGAQVRCVLVNGSTASAAELFAAALKDYAARGEVRAIVLGTKTYGKGTAQSVMRLSDNSAISISTKMYDPPYSGNYEGVGVKPDREVALSEEAQKINFYKLTDETDNQLQEAVSALS